MYVCMYVCMYACMHVCMYVGVYVCMYVYKGSHLPACSRFHPRIAASFTCSRCLASADPRGRKLRQAYIYLVRVGVHVLVYKYMNTDEQAPEVFALAHELFSVAAPVDLEQAHIIFLMLDIILSILSSVTQASFVPLSALLSDSLLM